MVVLIDLVFDELRAPFKDPRIFRSLEMAKS
jgi:hypothetical protein